MDVGKKAISFFPAHLFLCLLVNEIRSDKPQMVNALLILALFLAPFVLYKGIAFTH